METVENMGIENMNCLANEEVCKQLKHWQNLVKLYRFDHLTGLKQRYDFEVETMSKFKRQKFWLVMTDVTGLHKTNRERGYAAGDQLIKQVANGLIQNDNVWECYRIGGDEFCALFWEEPVGFEIDNATTAYVNSEDFTHFDEMFDKVDSLVTEKKSKLNRRRED